MRPLQLKLLGQFECSLGKDERIALPMRKADVLLAYLAIAPGLRHPRERLINLLWSDRSDEQARNSLRQCLSAIKKSLGDAADLILLVDRTTVCLKAELIEVDAHEFERLATEGDYESLATAASLYLGEFLEGISIRDAACQEWLDSERSRFNRQFIEILTNLAETQLVTHDFSHAIKSAERLVEQDPLGESGWRMLMRSYFEAGDRSHALQAFKRCQQALRNELDVDPENATVELRDQIAGGDAPKPQPSTPAVKNLPAEPGGNDHSIAVLPFDNLSGDPEQEYFSDGITESIILNLSLFPDLSVKSRNSSFAFKQQIKSIGEISQELEVDYIVEGSIRKADKRIRITVQLIEAASGNQVWGKRYDADVADLFQLEEDLSRTIATTVTGRIESDLQRIAITKGAAHLESYDLLLGGMYHLRQFSGPGMLIAIDKLNQCLEVDPNNVRAHALLYYCHSMNWMERWVEDYEPSLELAGNHARKAISLGPEVATSQIAYGEYLIICRENDQAAKHIEKALAINPNDADALATKSLNLTALGRYEEALQISELGCRLDHYHHWCDWSLAESQFFCGQYEESLHTIAISKNAPGFIRLYTIGANIKLGRKDQARHALQEFLEQARNDMLAMPRNRAEWLQYTISNAPYQDTGINEQFIEYMVEAGLEENMAPQSAASDTSDQPSILVLPFSNLSGDPEQEYFSDGITASLILSLGLFNGMNIKSQNSSFAFKNSSSSSAEIAEALDADFLIEGSMRKSGSKIRLSVQLVESASDTQIWGKQYNAELEDILELEQRLSQTIAATISGRIGHKLQQSAAHKPAKNLQSYDYLLRGLYHFGKFTAMDLEIARQEIGKCLEIDPDNSTAHTNMGMIHDVEILEGWTKDQTDSEKLANHHLEKAVQLDPDNALAHSYLAEQHIRLGDYDRSEFHADKAIELNPTASEGYTAKADLLGFCRRIEEAIPYADQCLYLDPHSVGSGWVAGDIYRKAGQFDKAIKTFRSISHPPVSIHALVAISFIGLSLPDEARKEMKRYQKLAKQQMSNYPQSEDEWRSLWRTYSSFQYDDDFDNMFEQLKQAGLCEDLIGAGDDKPSIVN